jgi:hypothetical protein
MANDKTDRGSDDGDQDRSGHTASDFVPRPSPKHGWDANGSPVYGPDP